MYVTYLYYVNKIIYCMIALMFSLSQMNPVTLFASIGLYIHVRLTYRNTLPAGL